MCSHHGPRDSTKGAVVSKGYFRVEEEKRVPYLAAEGGDCFWLKFSHGRWASSRSLLPCSVKGARYLELRKSKAPPTAHVPFSASAL